MAIRLEKSGDQHRINLEKGSDSAMQEIVINLDWSKGGFFKSMLGDAIDLDLGCYYEMCNGAKSCIDGLQFSRNRGGARDKQTRQGCYTAAPYIWHKGDDRGGSSESGETILVNPAGINEIKRIIVYTFIYEGVAKWADTNAVVKIHAGGQEVIVEMGKQYDAKKFCAIAELDFGGDNSITVKKMVSFHNGHSECGKLYNWGLNFTPGKKD